MFNTGIAKDLMSIVGATFSLTLVAYVITNAGNVGSLINSSTNGITTLIKAATLRN